MALFAVLFAAVLIGMSEAGFKCCRDISQDKNTNTLLNLTSLLNIPLTLESVCLQTCNQANCSSADAAAGLLGQVTGGVAGTLVDLVNGPAQCLLNPNGDGSNPNNLSPNTACMIPCILDLNLLDICDVQAIITSLIKICPKADVKGLCVSACLCCGKNEDPLDVCVNACLSNKGIGLNIPPLLGSGQGPQVGPVQLPPLPIQGGGAVGGILAGGSQDDKGGKEGILDPLLGKDGILGKLF
jgi:hypothetical protein